MDGNFNDLDDFTKDLDGILAGGDVPVRKKPVAPKIPAPSAEPTNIDDLLERMRGGTSKQESGGKTRAVNPDSGAAGEFQVMPANVPRWTKKYLNKSLSVEQFKADPKAQETVFRGEMGKYLKKALRRAKGDEDTAIRMAAAAWYGGEGAMHLYDDPKPQYYKGDKSKKYPSFREYTSKVLNRTKGGLPKKDGFADFLKGLDEIVPAGESKQPTIDDFVSGLDSIVPAGQTQASGQAVKTIDDLERENKPFLEPDKPLQIPQPTFPNPVINAEQFPVGETAPQKPKLPAIDDIFNQPQISNDPLAPPPPLSARQLSGDIPQVSPKLIFTDGTKESDDQSKVPAGKKRVVSPEGKKLLAEQTADGKYNIVEELERPEATDADYDLYLKEFPNFAKRGEKPISKEEFFAKSKDEFGKDVTVGHSKEFLTDEAKTEREKYQAEVIKYNENLKNQPQPVSGKTDRQTQSPSTPEFVLNNTEKPKKFGEAAGQNLKNINEGSRWYSKKYAEKPSFEQVVEDSAKALYGNDISEVNSAYRAETGNDLITPVFDRKAFEADIDENYKNGSYDRVGGAYNPFIARVADAYRTGGIEAMKREAAKNTEFMNARQSAIESNLDHQLELERQEKERSDPDYLLKKEAEDNIYNSFLSGGTREEVQKEIARLKKARIDPETIQKLEMFGTISKNSAANYFGGNSNITSGTIGAIGSLADIVAAVNRPLASLGITSDDAYIAWQKIGKGARIIENSMKGEGIISDAQNLVGRAAVDIPKYVAMSGLPGGAVIAFGLDAGLQSAGRGESLDKVSAETAKGLALGGIFHGAGKLAQIAEKGTLNALLPKGNSAAPDVELFSKLVGTTTRIGTIGTGSFAVEKLSGAETEDAFKSAIMMTLFDVVMQGKQYGEITDLAGKIFRMSRNGKTADVTVTPQGEVKLLKGKVPPEYVEAEFNTDKVIDVEIGKDGVYRAKTDVSASENIQTTTKTADLKTSQTPRELAAENPRRIETPKPDAVQKAAIDTRANKVVDFLKNKDAVSIEELQKQTRYNRNNVEDAVLLLYSAKRVEILPDNSVRLIGEDAPEVKKSLYERAAEIEQKPIEPIALEKSPIEKEINATELSKNKAEISQPSNKAVETKHEFSSTQVDIPSDISGEVLRTGKSLIKDEDIHPEEGREDKPHITVKFGLHTNDAAEVRRLLANEKPFEAKLGKVSIFDTNPEFDVVKVDVESPELHRLNKLIADNTKTTDTHPEYKPHLTLAYVKKGEGQKYVGNSGLEGKTIKFDSITFSDKNRNKISIPLGQNIEQKTAEKYDALPEQKAPEVKAPEKPKAQVVYKERENLAKKLDVFTERGTKALIEPKVIDASEILTSLDEGYPAEFQPRDRSRQASKAQIADIANKLNPELLGDSPKASDGRPLVVPVEMPDGATRYAVISGNGRSEAIRAAYALENEPSARYAEFANSKAQNSKLAKPVYVGILDPNEIKDLSGFAKEANESSVAQMSATEQARADAERLDADTLNLFVPSDDGTIHSAANRDFTRAFLEKIASPTERGKMVDADGRLNQEGVLRVRNAIFAKAFGDSERGLSAIQRMSESTDNNVKNITSGLLTKAGAIAALKEAARAGTRYKEFDISSDLATAMEKYASIKESGTSMDEYIAQGNLFGAETTPFQTRVMQVFDNYRRSPKAIRSIIANFLSVAEEAGNPSQQNLFGEKIKIDVKSAFEAAVESYEKTNAAETRAQADLFGENQGLQLQSDAEKPFSENARTSVAETSGGQAAQLDRSGSRQEIDGIQLSRPSGTKTGEINLKNLYNKQGEFDYEQVKNVAERIGSGELKITRLAPREEQGRIAGGRRNVEASIISGADARTNRVASRGSGQTRQERVEANRRVETQLEKYARHEGIWFDYNKFENDHTYLKSGEEARVYKERNSNFVLKAVDYAYFDPKYSPLEFIDERISLFNFLFPETKYELVGFTRDNDGRFRFILKQPYIAAGKIPTSRKVSEFMKGVLGADSELTSEQFANFEHHVSDLHLKNVIQDKNGNIFVIDALTELTPERLGGTREYADFAVHPVKDDMQFSRVSKLGFFSQVERVIENSPQNKFSREQVKALLNPAKTPGIIESFLDTKDRFTKQEVLEYIAANQVEVEEVVKGENPKLTIEDWEDGIDGALLSSENYDIFEDNGRYYVVSIEDNTDLGTYDSIEDAKQVAEQDLNKDWRINDNTKFSQFTLPGGEFYKEVFVTAPNVSKTDLKRNTEGYWEYKKRDGETVALGNKYLSEHQALSQMKARGDYAGWSDGHDAYSDIINPVVRLRWNERTTSDGKRMLFLEEVQGVSEENEAKMPDILRKNAKQIGLKYAMRYAAENGFDLLGWTAGQVQADRYNLQKYVDRIEYRKSGILEDKYTVKVYDKDGRLADDKVWNEDELSRQVGKDLAKKIVDTAAPQAKILSGLELKVGGEGLASIYDKILPSFANKIGKKFGANVQDVQINTTDGQTKTVHSLTITPEMRESVLSGQALFNRKLRNEDIALAKQLKILARKTVSDVGASSRAVFNSEKQTLELNAAGTTLIRMAILQATGNDPGIFFGAYMTPERTENVHSALIIFHREVIKKGNYDSAQKIREVIKVYDEASRNDFKDVTIVIDEKGRQFVKQFTEQEELSHRADFRVRNFAPQEIAAYQKLDGYRKAVENVKSDYPDASQRGLHNEVIAKANRSDAEKVLGISYNEIDEILDIYNRQLIDAGVDVETVAREFGGIGYQADRNVKRYAKQHTERTSDRRPRRNNVEDVGGRANSIYDSAQIPPGVWAAGRTPGAKTFERKSEFDGIRSNGTGQSGTSLTPVQQRYVDRVKDKTLAKAVETEILLSKPAAEKWTVGKIALDLVSMPKSIKASVDLSAAGRQGLILSVSAPRIAAQSFKKQLQSFSEKRYERFKRDLDLHPYIELAEESGLYLGSLAGESLAAREEQFMSRLLGDEQIFSSKLLELPRRAITLPIRASERAYVTYLDNLRIESFAKLAKEINEFNLRKGKPNEIEQFQALAKFINNATGRGGLGKLEDAAPLLNAAFFSARYWSSRLQLLNPLFYKNLPPGVRKIAMRKMAGFLGAYSLAMGLLWLAGGEIDFDEMDDPNMFKIRFGDYTYDFGAGLIQQARYIGRMISAIGEPNSLDKQKRITERYVRSKLSPVPGAVWNAAAGKNFIGEPTDTKTEFSGLFVPITIDNFSEAASAEGLTGVLKTSPEFFGIGGTRYTSVKEIREKIAQEKANLPEKPTIAERREHARRMKAWESVLKSAAKREAEQKKKGSN